MDTGDKAINKAMAIAYKYLCFQLFCIPVEDMTDPDGESHELKDDKAGKEKGKGNAQDKKGSGAKAKSESADQTEGRESEKDQGGRITEAMLTTIRSEQKRTGVSDKAILSRLHTKAKKIEELSVEEFKQVMKIFEVTRTLKEEANEHQ